MVSIIVAVHNEERTIQRCLDSLISQTEQNTEIIVVNDGSTDRTRQIVESFVARDSRLKLIDIEHQGKGGSRPRNIGVKNSQGEILWVVEADGYYQEDYLEKCLTHFNRPEVAGVLGDGRVWEPDNWLAKYRDVMMRVRNAELLRIRREIKQGKIAPWVFRRKVYNEVGGYPENLIGGEDLDFAERILAAGYRIEFEPSVVMFHKWEENSLWKNVLRNYRIGHNSYSFLERKAGKGGVLLNLIRLLFPVYILIFSLFYPWLLFLLLIQILRGFFYGVWAYRRARGYEYRPYLLLKPFVDYITGIPYALGLLSQVFRL